MRIAFASGKGGTGKTTLAVNTAYLLSLAGYKVQYLDFDVEEPDGHIFLQPEIKSTFSVKVWVPSFNREKCTFCGSCVKYCEFKALFALPGELLFFPELCHSCKVCLKVCKDGAINHGERNVGVVRVGNGLSQIHFVEGVLNVGEPMPTFVIREVKKHYIDEYIQIIDAPPGTSCPFVKSIYDADFLVLVTEPTPFGLHDLKICVNFAKSIDKPVGVIINRYRDHFAPLMEYLSKEGIPILTKILEDLRIARAYSEGKLIFDMFPEYRICFEEAFSKLKGLVHG